MKRPAEAALEVAQHRIDPVEFRQIPGVLTASADGLRPTAARTGRTEAGQGHREHPSGEGMVACRPDCQSPLR